MSIFILIYNISRRNKSKINWLNLENKEGVDTGLMSVIFDSMILIQFL
jgi:hypothetical protein